MFYKQRNNCRICFSEDLVDFLGFGLMPLAGGFIKQEEDDAQQLYPLSVMFCRNCKEVQLRQSVSGDVLFKDYRYVSSTTQTLSRHFAAYAKAMTERFLNKDSLVVEFGCNDGVLLKPFVDLGVKAVGVEPAVNIARLASAKGCTVINDFFNTHTAEQIAARYGLASLICANNVFAHIDDMHQPMRAIVRLLKPQGVFVFEVHYLLSLLQGCQYDMIYHEHMMHHSLTALRHLMMMYDMEIFDVRLIPIHAGSIRVYAQRRKTGLYVVDARVSQMYAQEQSAGLTQEETWIQFAQEVVRKRDALKTLVLNLRAQGKSVVGYGASGRASVHLNYCQFTPAIIPYVTDESAERQGRYIPGMRIPIVSPQRLRQEQPDYAVLFAYNFFDEVMRKEQAYIQQGGRFIVPLPEPKIIDPVGIMEDR